MAYYRISNPKNSANIVKIVKEILFFGILKGKEMRKIKSLTLAMIGIVIGLDLDIKSKVLTCTG